MRELIRYKKILDDLDYLKDQEKLFILFFFNNL